MYSLFTCHDNSSTFVFRRVLGNKVWLKFGEISRWITLSSIHTLPEMYICLEIIPFPQIYGLIMAKTFSKQVGFSLSPFQVSFKLQVDHRRARLFKGELYGIYSSAFKWWEMNMAFRNGGLLICPFNQHPSSLILGSTLVFQKTIGVRNVFFTLANKGLNELGNSSKEMSFVLEVTFLAQWKLQCFLCVKLELGIS